MVWKLAKWVALAVGAALLSLAIVLAGVRQRGADGPDNLPRSLVSSAEEVREAQSRDGRLIKKMAMEDPLLGRISFVVSLPDPPPERPLPVIVALGGLGPGEDTLRHLPPAGDNVIIGYDWPFPNDFPDGVEFVWNAGEYYEQTFKVPGQIDAAVSWAADQPWADRERITFLTVSLGAIVAPATQRLLEERGVSVGWTVLAYGGAGLGELLRGHPKFEGYGAPLAWATDWLFNPLDPAEHLPPLTGRFLVIGGSDDRLISEKSTRLLEELTPEPKTILLIEGRHIGVGGGQDALRAKIVDATVKWLLQENAINAL